MVGKYVLFVAIETAALKNTSKKWIRVGETKKTFFEEVDELESRFLLLSNGRWTKDNGHPIERFRSIEVIH